MKKINLFLSLIAVVMLVGLTNCKKETENTSVTKYVGTVNGSFLTQDVNISVSKTLTLLQHPLQILVIGLCMLRILHSMATNRLLL